MNVLVDTPIWSLALRRKRHQLNDGQKRLVAELEVLIGDAHAAILGAVRQEVLSGIRDEGAFETIRSALRAFDDVTLKTVDYETAAQASNICRSVGLAASPIDLLICSVAQRTGFTIFTTDTDFKRYAKHLPIQLYESRASDRRRRNGPRT